VLLAFSDDQGTAWQALSHAVRTGELAFRHYEPRIASNGP